MVTDKHLEEWLDELKSEEVIVIKLKNLVAFVKYMNLQKFEEAVIIDAIKRPGECIITIDYSTPKLEFKK